MEIKRVNCFSASCCECKNAVLIKKNILGDKIYMCSYKNKNHKQIYGEDCEFFRCNLSNPTILCDYCNRGNCVNKITK